MTSRLTRLLVASAAAAGIAAGSIMGAPIASADSGGDGNPFVSCPNGYSIAQAPIMNGSQQVGLVELRWSYSCGGNWARTTSYIGARDLQAHTYRANGTGVRAMGWDSGVTQNVSPFIRVGASERMCAYGSVRVNPNANPGAVVCSN